MTVRAAASNLHSPDANVGDSGSSQGYGRRVTHTLDPSAGLGGHPDDPIVLLGTVDAGVGSRVGEMLAERAAAGATRYQVDLSGVEAIDEHGLVALVRVWQEMSASGRSLLLVDPSPAVGPLLAMTGLSATYSER